MKLLSINAHLSWRNKIFIHTYSCIIVADGVLVMLKQFGDGSLYIAAGLLKRFRNLYTHGRQHFVCVSFHP